MLPRKYSCGPDAAIDVIGGRWKALILWALHDGPVRTGPSCSAHKMSAFHRPPMTSMAASGPQEYFRGSMLDPYQKEIGRASCRDAVQNEECSVYLLTKQL